MSSKDRDEELCDKCECSDLYTWVHTLNYICWQHTQVLTYWHTVLKSLMGQTQTEWLIFLLCTLNMENAGYVGTSSLFKCPSFYLHNITQPSSILAWWTKINWVYKSVFGDYFRWWSRKTVFWVWCFDLTSLIVTCRPFFATPLWLITPNNHVCYFMTAPALLLWSSSASGLTVHGGWECWLSIFAVKQEKKNSSWKPIFLPLCLSPSSSLCQRSNQRYFQFKSSALINQNIFGEDLCEPF